MNDPVAAVEKVRMALLNATSAILELEKAMNNCVVISKEPNFPEGGVTYKGLSAQGKVIKGIDPITGHPIPIKKSILPKVDPDKIQRYK